MAHSSLAGPAEEEVHAAFEWFCLSNLDRIEAIPQLFDQIGVPPLAEDRSKPFLAPHSGTAWLMNGNHAKLLITLTNDGVCSIYGRHADPDESILLFEVNARPRHLETEHLGSQVQDLFAVVFPHPNGGPDIRSFVVITRSKLPSIKGVLLSALPEQLARDLGIASEP